MSTETKINPLVAHEKLYTSIDNNLAMPSQLKPGEGRVILAYPLTVDEDIGAGIPGTRFFVCTEKSNYVWEAEQAIAKGEILFMVTMEQIKQDLREKGIPYELLYPRLDMKEHFIAKANGYRQAHWAVNFYKASWNTSLRHLSSDSYASKHHLCTPTYPSFVELLLAGAI